MSPLAAAALAAGELVCEFSDGYRRSLLAGIADGAPRTELLLVYEALQPDSAEVLSSRQPGRRPVLVREGARFARGAVARAWQRYRRRRDARAIYMALSDLDDRTLRDLGFHRSEIGSVAAEATGEAEPTRVLARAPA